MFTYVIEITVCTKMLRLHILRRRCASTSEAISHATKVPPIVCKINSLGKSSVGASLGEPLETEKIE